jgi:hypothetical protein
VNDAKSRIRSKPFISRGDGIRVSVGEEESVDVLLRVLGELVDASQERPST